MRESSALDILELLTRHGAIVSFTDPFVPSIVHGGTTLESMPFERTIEQQHDCAVIATDHKVFDYARIASLPLVVDTRNALKAFSRPSIVHI